ncbi:hypothetical protein ABH905_003999 [Pseudomonas frederiksbergensis]|jgi:hypothetical protein
MALSEMSIRHAQITGIDYMLGDSDGLTLNVTASGGVPYPYADIARPACLRLAWWRVTML